MYKNDIYEKLIEYEKYLQQKDLSERTLQKYMSDVNKFLNYSDENEIDGKYIHKYKEYLLINFAPKTVNSYIITLNLFLKWMDYSDFCLKSLRIQRKNNLENVLTEEEYERLLEECKKREDYKYYVIMKTLGMTGIRVGELKYITLDSVREKKVAIYNKGKYRTVYLPNSLCELLYVFYLKNGSTGKIIFEGRNKNQAINNSGIWRGLKRIAEYAGVNKEKVYPHSFRHLFAKTYMKKIGNISELADILGHSNIEITRLYTISTSEEKRKNMEKLGL